MKDGKNIAEYIELHDGLPRGSFNTEDRGKLDGLHGLLHHGRCSSESPASRWIS